MYAAQSMRNKWTSVLGTDMGEDDSDQDSLKVHNISELNNSIKNVAFQQLR